MGGIPIEVLEQVEREVPEVVDAIQQRRSGPIVLLFSDFEGQEDLFFNTVWYATSHGRQVVIDPSH